MDKLKKIIVSLVLISMLTTTIYDAVIAHVTSETLSKQEIIKFVEGFKY